MTGGRRRMSLVAMALGLAGLHLEASQGTTGEYELKAAMLYKFTAYVDWPASAFEPGDSKFRIGYVGKDVFEGALERTVKERKAKERAVEIVRFASAEDAKPCAVLFVSQAESANLEKIAGALKGTSTLIITETEGAARRGGIINFYLQGKEVRFEVNPEAALRERLRIGAQLLRLARIVKD
jgi:hypothetical protein